MFLKYRGGPVDNISHDIEPPTGYDRLSIDTQSSGGNRMSDKSEGPGWWIASDGKWYPPELHPSVRNASRTKAAAGVATSSQSRWQGPTEHSERSEHVGPRFPDLFQKAMEGSHLADNVSVKYSGDDRRNVTRSTSSRSMVGAGSGGSARASTDVGSTINPPAKRKGWRKGR
jgi:hypothetical protein